MKNGSRGSRFRWRGRSAQQQGVVRELLAARLLEHLEQVRHVQPGAFGPETSSTTRPWCSITVRSP
jgi:hypothetical protein